MREDDGLSYAVSSEWAARTFDSPPDESHRRQLLEVARYFMRVGATVAFVGESDRWAFPRSGLDAVLGRVEPWFVRD